MKKFFSLLLALTIMLSFSSVLAADGDIVLLPTDATESSGVEKGATISGFEINDYFGFKDLDLTGMNSVIL